MITTNIATINISGITSTTRMQMLRNFIYKHDIDILFMQEVTHPSLGKLNGYTVHYNIGSEQRGTAIVARDNIDLSNITRMPSGRAIAAEFKGIWLVNIYAPSGAAKRNEREQFFNTELTYILRAAPENTILGGDFNCVLEKAMQQATLTIVVLLLN
jgi:exonuclease III